MAQEETPVSWDRLAAAKLREQGLTQEQIGFVLGLLAEHRMRADSVGYERGYEDGHSRAVATHASSL